MNTTDLLLSSGNGPAECRMALLRLVEILEREAARHGCLIDVTMGPMPDHYGPRSAIVSLRGDNAGQMRQDYCGTLRFIFKSPLRPTHKRQNWFVSVRPIVQPATAAMNIDPADIRFETLRAGGPGGQHQNTTDSAVRIVHRPTGIQIVARNERSQHRNKALALERLGQMLRVLHERELEDANADRHRNSLAIERGNAVKTFRL